MSIDLYKGIAAFFIFLISIVIAIYPIKKQTSPQHHVQLERGDAFASGIFLGAALFHMLPEAIRDFSSIFPSIQFPLAESFCAGGFLILLFLERLSGFVHKNSMTHVSLILASILIIHSLIEGAALGIATTTATTFILSVAIFAHKGSESFALAMILNRSTLSFKIIMGLIALFSCMTPLGILMGVTLTEVLKWRGGQFLSAAFSAFAAGTFLYMSTLHHINHHHTCNEREGFIEFWFLIVGLLIMAALALLA